MNRAAELQNWLRFLQAETHILRLRPWLLFQQAANHPDSSIPAQAAVSLIQRKGAPHAWLAWRNKDEGPTPLLNTIEAHGNSVSACRSAPLLNRIASAGLDGAVKIWNGTTTSQVAALAQFSPGKVVIALSPNESKIAAGSADGLLKILDTATGFERLTIAQRGSAMVGCEFSADGRHLTAAFKNGLVRTWNSENGEVISELQLNVDAPEICVVSPGATRIFWATSNTGYLFNLDDGNIVARIEGYGGIVCASFSPDASRLVAATSEERLVIWNALNGALVSNFIHHMSFMIYATVVEPQHFSACSFSPDGQFIVTGSFGGSIKLWNAKDGVQVANFANSSTAAIACCAFSSDGLGLLTGSSDGSLRVWDAHAGSPPSNSSEVFSEEVTCLSSSSDGTQFLAATTMLAHYSTTGTIMLVDSQSGSVTRGDFVSTSITSCALRPGNEVLMLYNTGELYRWRINDGRPQALDIKLQAHVVSAISPDASRLVTGNQEGQLILWSVSGLQIAETKKGADAVSACSFSPDGQLIAAGYKNGTLELYSGTLNSQPRSRFDLPTTVRCCVFAENRLRIMAGLDDGTLQIFDGNETSTTKFPQRSHACAAVALSPHGEFIATGYADGWILIWNINTGQLIAEHLLGNSATAIAWSTNGVSIAAGTARAQVQVFHLQNFPLHNDET